MRKRVQLLDAQDGHIVNTFFFPLFNQIVVNLARAGDQAFDLIRLFTDVLLLLRNDGLEAALGEFRQGRSGVLVAQQRLGRHDDQGLANVAHHLAPQDVKNLTGRRRLHHLHIGVCAELHEALQPG